MHLLNTKWILWFHNPLDNNWNIDSYINIATITSIEDFWGIYNNIDSKIIENGMLFLMRDKIEPLWEHTENINGGSWSFKIPKENIKSIWDEISINLCIENVSNNDKNIINGISISPKKKFSILKIWNKNKNIDSIENLNKLDILSYDESLYKPHC
jgi:hypothetical protein